MGLSRQLQLLLTFGSLATAAWIAKTATGDDDDDTPLPLVIWHGLGDTYSNPGIVDVGDIANEVNPGTLVHIVHIGSSANSDRSATFLGNVNEHVDKLCADLAADPIISTAPAIDAVGFSQGGQFLRAYVERCNSPPVRSLVTFGSQHNGISEFMACGLVDVPCHAAVGLLRTNVWSDTVQTRVVPAQYFRDPSTPDKYAKYLEHSGFLADINNERPGQRNARYKDNIAAMTNFAMYMFEDDTTAIPKESAWFSEVNGTDVTPLHARALYQEDWLGLRALDERGGLHFRTVPGEHMQLQHANLSAVFAEFMGPAGKKFASAPKTPSPVLDYIAEL